MADRETASYLHPQWLEAATNLQEALHGVRTILPAKVRSLKDLRRHIRALLLEAIKEGALLTGQDVVERLLQPCTSPNRNLQEELKKVELQEGERLHVLLGGGARDGTRFEDGTRSGEFDYFKLADGWWLDFAVTVRESRRGLELEGYIFRRSPPETTEKPAEPRFLRVDMNLSNHQNERDGLRVHLHPGNNDLQIPVPWMSPEQVLKLFLYGVPTPVKQRHSQA